MAIRTDPRAASPEHFSSSWDTGLRWQAALFAGTFASLLALAALGDRLPWLGRRLEQHAFREWTGFAALAFLAFQLMLTVKKRWLVRMPRSFEAWRGAHKLNGLFVLWMVALHTGGVWGTRLNAAMMIVLVALMLLSQGGHVVKAYLYERARVSGGAAAASILRLHEAANTDEGWVHRVGLHLHVLLATLLWVLVAFHVIAVYYF